MFKDSVNYRFWRTAVAVFGLMAVLNYLPILSGRIPFPRDLVLRHSAWNGQPQEQLPELIDIVAMFYPFRALLERGANERTLPLWNPHIMGGAPFQANAQSAVFAPLNIVYYVLPLKIAWAASLAIRLFLAAIFMAMFVRSIGGSATGAIVSGILFAFCGFTIAWQGMSNGDSSIWLPLMCYAVHRLHLRPDRRSIAVAAVAFSMPLLSGHPETAAHSAAVTCGLAGFLWIFPHRSNAPRFEFRFVTVFVLAGLLGLGLASVQLIPTLEWLGQLGLKVEAPQPVLDRHQAQGLFSRDISRNPSSAILWIPEASAYVGMLGLMAAALTFLHPSRRYVYFLAGIAVIAGAVAFGIQPLRWIITQVPIVKAMKNGRLTLVLDFALAGLAGIGISAIGEQFVALAPGLRRRVIAVMGAVFVVVSFCIYEVHRATLTPVELLKSPLSSLMFLVAAFVAIALRLNGALKSRSFLLLICSLAGLEMLSFSYGYGGFAPTREVFPPAPVFDFLSTQDNSEPFRVAKDRFPIPHDAGMIYGFDAADGYDLTTERTRTFAGDLIESREDGVMFLAENILAAQDRRFDMLNVKYLIVSQPGTQFDALADTQRFVPVFSKDLVAVFENKTVLPRFFSVPIAGIEVIRESDAQLARLKDASFDPEKSVVFSDMPAAGPAASNSGINQTHIQVTGKGINRYRLRVELREPAVVVASQMYYPGWKATVDGAEIPVYPVNVALTAMVLPSGSHDVSLFFQPTSFRIGSAISLVSLVVMGGLLIRTGRSE